MVPYRSFPQCCFFCPKRKIPRLTKSNTKIERFQATVLECLKKPFYLSGWCFSMNGSMRSLAPSTAFWLWAHRQARNRFPYSIHLEHGRNRITPKRLRLTHNFDCSAVFRIRYPTGSLLNAFLDPDPDTLKKNTHKNADNFQKASANWKKCINKAPYWHRTWILSSFQSTLFSFNRIERHIFKLTPMSCLYYIVNFFL